MSVRLPLKMRLFTSAFCPPRSVIDEYIAPAFANCPKNVELIETKTPLKPGEPLLGMCVTGGTEAPFLKTALENPKSPAVILVHNKANSYASGCELAARLSYEHRVGNRAPAIFCSVNDPQSVKSVFTAAATASLFQEKNPNLGVIGEPSPWLVASGRFAEKLPGMFNMKLTNIHMDEFLGIALKNRSVIEALEKVISKYKLDGFTIRCFDLLPHKMTACLQVSEMNDRGYTATCEGDIASMVTMHLMKTIANSPVFMANATGFVDDYATFAHCTIPRKLVTSSTVDTHFESGLGEAVVGKVKEGKWTLCRFGGDGRVMADVVDVKNPETLSADHCRTQIMVTPSKKLAKRLRKGDLLGNHFLFVPGDIKDELLIFNEAFRVWKK